MIKYQNSNSVFVKIDWERQKWHCPFHEMPLPPLKIDVDYGWFSKLSSVRCQTENSFHVMSLQSMIQNWNKISKHFLIPAWQQQRSISYIHTTLWWVRNLTTYYTAFLLKSHWNMPLHFSICILWIIFEGVVIIK